MRLYTSPFLGSFRPFSHEQEKRHWRAMCAFFGALFDWFVICYFQGISESFENIGLYGDLGNCRRIREGVIHETGYGANMGLYITVDLVLSVEQGFSLSGGTKTIHQSTISCSFSLCTCPSHPGTVEAYPVCNCRERNPGWFIDRCRTPFGHR